MPPCPVLALPSCWNPCKRPQGGLRLVTSESPYLSQAKVLLSLVTRKQEEESSQCQVESGRSAVPEALVTLFIWPPSDNWGTPWRTQIIFPTQRRTDSSFNKAQVSLLEHCYALNFHLSQQSHHLECDHQTATSLRTTNGSYYLCVASPWHSTRHKGSSQCRSFKLMEWMTVAYLLPFNHLLPVLTQTPTGPEKPVTESVPLCSASEIALWCALSNKPKLFSLVIC